MGPVLPLRPRRSDSPEIQARAMDNLQFIRGMMESAAAFTALSGWGQAAVGVTALVAAAVAQRQLSPLGWMATWLGEAGIAAGIAVASMAIKAHLANQPLLAGPLRKLILSFSPAMIVGGVLTVVLAQRELYALLPGAWMLLYGAAIVSAGAFSVRSLPVMGAVFMTVGTVALIAPPAWGTALMAVGFGVVHIGFGVWIARRHGG